MKLLSKIKKMEMDLICYNNGKYFVKTKFQPVKNCDIYTKFSGYAKPVGGLWTSPKGCYFGWKEWCIREGFEEIKESFKIKYIGNTFIIDSYEDLEIVPKAPMYPKNMIDELDILVYYAQNITNIDAEELISNGVDAIYLTNNGLKETHCSFPLSLNTWDCETVFVMNVDSIKSSQRI